MYNNTNMVYVLPYTIFIGLLSILEKRYPEFSSVCSNSIVFDLIIRVWYIRSVVSLKNDKDNLSMIMLL